MKNTEFYRSLHSRGLNQKKLAALAGTGRAHLSEVLANKPGHGNLTRRRVFPYLTLKEVAMLDWVEEFRRWVENLKNGRCSTGNIVPTEGIR